MSESMELLNSIADAEITGDEENIVINRDRTITVPEALKRIGVQYDHNVKTVTFDCPRYWDGRDLSTMKLYINYMRVDGVYGSFLAENVVVDDTDETILHFDWTITENVTKVEGSLIFVVCAKKTDETTEELINHWNSDLNEDMYVSKGMDCVGTSATAYPDVITQLLTRVDTVENKVDNLSEQMEVVATATETNAEGIEALRNLIESKPWLPKLAAQDTWYKGATAKSTITEIHIVDTYTPDGTETETWNADVDDRGAFKCYLEGTILTIAGNGSGSILANPDSHYGFAGFTKVTTIMGSDILDTSAVTNMGAMFDSCKALTTLDVSNWDTSNVTNMKFMFSECQALTTLDVSNWDTSNVTNMDAMFDSCKALTTLDVSNWDTSNVTGISSMFSGCKALTTLDVSNWDTSNVTGLHSMFSDCQALTTLDVSNWDTSNVTSMVYAFNWCKSLTTLDVSNWDTSNVTNMNAMFAGCTSLAQVSIGSGFKFVGTNGYLRAPSATYITGADGLWYTEDITGETVGYTPAQIATDNAGKAATYRAVK